MSFRIPPFGGTSGQSGGFLRHVLSTTLCFVGRFWKLTPSQFSRSPANHQLKPYPSYSETLPDRPLLHAVFEPASLIDARLLSPAPRKLNEIRRANVFGVFLLLSIGLASLDSNRLQTRTLTFGLPLTYRRKILDVDDPMPYLEQLPLSERNKLLSTTEFLVSRPDLTAKMRTVFMEHNWQPSSFKGTRAEGFQLTGVEPRFFNLVRLEITKILAVSSNLTSVTLGHFELTVHVIQLPSDLCFLHTLHPQAAGLPHCIGCSVHLASG
jgi:hypothetical protein